MQFKLLALSAFVLAASAQAANDVPDADVIQNSLPDAADAVPSGSIPSADSHAPDTGSRSGNESSVTKGSHTSVPSSSSSHSVGRNATHTGEDGGATKTGAGHDHSHSGGVATATGKPTHPTSPVQTGEGVFARGSASTAMASLLFAGALSFFVFA